MTANGTDISDGESLSGSQVVRVYGSNLTPPYFSLWFNGVEYTPLDYGDGYVEYVLQDNGTYEIKVDDSVFMSFDISGITIPSDITNFRRMVQRTDDVVSVYSGTITHAREGNVNCLNYPFKDEGIYNYALILWGVDAAPLYDDFEFHNCEINNHGGAGLNIAFNVSVIDNDIPAYIVYKGFIIYVFNYTTTPQP